MTAVGVLIYPEVEVLDFCGPFEVFRNVEKVGNKDINLFTISQNQTPVDAQGLSINPDYDFQSCPELDILIIPGGNGRWLIEQKEYLDFVEQRVGQLQHLISVCTGAFLIGKLGLLKRGMTGTTHLVGIDYLQDLAPEADILPDVRFTDNGKIIMSGGISAGIDASLYMVKSIWNEQLANEIALYMEYDWNYVEAGQEYIRPKV